MPKSTGRFLTYEQKKQIEALLQEHMTEKELEPGAYQWDEDWNDMRVMHEVGAQSPTQISAFRTELGFKLQRRTQGNTGLPSKTEVLASKVDDVSEKCVLLEERIERAITTIMTLEKRITKLEAGNANSQPVLIPEPWPPKDPLAR